MKKNTILTQNPSLFIIIILCAVISVFNTSCTKLVDIDPQKNALTAGAVFSDSVTVQSALIGMYATGSAYSGGITYLNGLYTDELTNNAYTQFQDNALTTADLNVGAAWSQSYATIYKANAIIEGVQSSATLSAKARSQATGEAKFFRAFCHFYLQNTFGNVPLITTTDLTVTGLQPQTVVATVYQQIISDLKDAADALPADYSLSAGKRVRVNKYAAAALLARVYLYTGDYAGAETQASLVISNSNYALQADLTKVFLTGSSEAIWQYDATATGYPAIVANFLPSAGAQPQFIIRPELLKAFEAGDARKTNWIGTSAGFAYPAKYYTLSAGLQQDVVLRLAEQYLIRSEARVQQGNITGAQTDLNVIRNRAGLTATTAGDKATLLLAIEQERRVELFCEWGQRFFDLKRTARLDAVLTPEKPGIWKSTAAQYPIPAVEIAKNSNLIQNGGY